MAKAKETQFDKFAQRIPQLNIVSDNPLKDEDVRTEQFNLRYRVGPIFDIIRHDKTQTPMTIAIYGTWGTGKTTSMEWLDRLLKEWNTHLKNNPAIKNERKVRTVWFYPWKYHNKEDVWRGLISEVVLKSINVKEMTIERVKKAVKDFGFFLGRSFINVVASTTIKSADTAAVDLSAIKEILSDFDKTSHPEKAFLNEFEETLAKWVEETISSKKERMVIFIDDLDRCTPDVAFEVLEALKLYLKIKDLIFIIGLDREIIDKIVENHYEKIGFTNDSDRIKSRKYLDKMFQVEVKVGPSLKQIENYTDSILKGNDFLKKNIPEKNEYNAVKKVILSLGGRNPREIKRLVNSASMEGMGANLISQEAGRGRDRISYTVAQGVQLFLIDKILQKRHPRLKDFIGSGDDVGFFGQWSQIVRDHFSDDLSKASFKLPKEYEELLSRELADLETKMPEDSRVKRQKVNIELTAQGDVPVEFHEFLKNVKYTKYVQLMEDEDLGRLMCIKYPQETGLITEVKKQTVEEFQDDEKIFDDAIRKIVNKPQGAINDNDYQGIKELRLRNRGLKNLSASIAKLTNLQMLDLAGNQLTDLPEVIAKLMNLQTISVGGNQLTDLPEAITKLTNLQSLYLDGNRLVTLPEAIAQLTNLKALYLLANQLIFLPEAIAKLTSLQMLNLAGNQLISLPEAVTKLMNLQSLDLGANRLTVLPEAIAQLTNLQMLYLMGNQLTSLPEAVTKLTNLKTFDLRHNQLTELPEAIAQLTNLQKLHLGNNQLIALPEAIAQLTNLQELELSSNQLTTLPEEIVKLTNLQELYLSSNRLTTLPEAIAELTNMQKLYLVSNQLTTLPEEIAKLKNLKVLFLFGNKFSKEEQSRIKKLLPDCQIAF